MDLAATGIQLAGMAQIDQINQFNSVVQGQLGAVGGIIMLVLVAFFLLVFWKLFQKAGYKGYESLIKGHNGYLMILMSGKPGWWYFLFLIPVLLFIIGIQIATVSQAFSQILMILGAISFIYLYVVISRGLAKKFGKGIWFTVGLILLPFIFYPILALGKAKYKK